MKKTKGKIFKSNPLKERVRSVLKLVTKESWSGNSQAVGNIEVGIPYKKYNGKYLKN